MQIRFHCPHCDLPMRISRWESLENFVCPRCEKEIPTYVNEAARRDLNLDHCLICNSHHLFRQKAFNRNVGIGIVVAGVIVSFFVSMPIIPLLAVGLIDLFLYLFLKFMVVCYLCDAEFRGFKGDKIRLFDHLMAAKAKRELVYPGAEE